MADRLTLNEDLFEESNKPYKIRFYKLKGSDKGNLDHEEFFDTKKEAINRYREVFKKELFSLNPTVWELRDGDYKRLMNHELVDESLKESYINPESKEDVFKILRGNTSVNVFKVYERYKEGNKDIDKIISNAAKNIILNRLELSDRDGLVADNEAWDAITGATDESLNEDLTLVPQEPSEETPATPEANGVAKLILDAINDESDTIKMYNDLIANTDNEDIIKIIQDITAEENNHIGMLQRALEIVSPNASNIDDGMEEAESMIEEPVANAEADFVPIGESLNEELSSEDKHTLFEYNQQIQDKIGDMLYVFDHKEHPKAYKDIVKASFLISEAVDDCLGDKDIDESLKESDEDRIKYLKGRLGEIVKAIENGADPERLAVEKNRIMDELHKLGCDDGWFDESLNEKKITEPRSAHYKNCDIVKDLQDKFWEIKYRGRQTIKDGFKSFMDAKAWIDDNLISGKLNQSLVTEDIHDKFKRDIKTAYKKWASDVERVEAKRKEAMDMIPDNASKEQISQYTDFVNNKIYPMVSDFDYEFPHNIEKGDFPFYVTYYSEYPIYEPAEGGYYYAGRDAVWSQGFNSEEEARQFLNDFIVEDGEDWEQDQDGRYTVHGKYIGQDQTVKLEPNQDYLSAIAGWHPYE